MWTYKAVSLFLLAVSSSLASAGVYPLDDSASVVHGGSTQMHWRSMQPGQRMSMAVDGRVRVNVVLNTRPWTGKHARVYMVMAPQPVRLTLQWTTRGHLLAGRIEPGQRVLVFDGTIPGASLQDFMDVALSADGREFATPQRVRVSYEIEVAG